MMMSPIVKKQEAHLLFLLLNQFIRSLLSRQFLRLLQKMQFKLLSRKSKKREKLNLSSSSLQIHSKKH
jgi:hypothetical protein